MEENDKSDKEIDFIATRGSEKMYVQVAYLIKFR